MTNVSCVNGARTPPSPGRGPWSSTTDLRKAADDAAAKRERVPLIWKLSDVLLVAPVPAFGVLLVLSLWFATLAVSIGRRLVASPLAATPPPTAASVLIS